MSKQIKKLKFENNNYGIDWLDIDQARWIIVDACHSGRHLVGRACRLADRGLKLEYRTGNGYARIEADIKMMV